MASSFPVRMIHALARRLPVCLRWCNTFSPDVTTQEDVVVHNRGVPRHTPTSTIESESIGKNASAVTVHIRQCFADLRKCKCLYSSPLHSRSRPETERRKHIVKTVSGAAPQRRRPHTPRATSSRGYVAAVRVQPGL